ncbi:3-oxo-5-alpha-steroid 4-dehydrogenase 2b isoform X2 [Gambusia affinis]|uniref:3-oxo-5-alpha-steroid 4-dehydrogenase 2b isoform X2 n=1 Tax=Gambusia affinis TaxID=33528 RepID=UPI001CDBDD49|nr:3-oxo-5-alpha-steroid 4-dehydrogenase 2b isoform X2 [Gambusia affinis]
MHCYESVVNYLSWGMLLAGLLHLINHRKAQASYGRHMKPSTPAIMVPARVAWFLQEMPALLMPLLLMHLSRQYSTMGRAILLKTFCLHYFHRTFVYSLLTRGQPFPLSVMATAGFFCLLNGFLQGHYLLHCAQFDEEWTAGYCYTIGLVVFYIGMAINIHSDYILRNLRKPKEIVYKIPAGGLFEYVSGANYFGELVEWFGYAIVTWSLPGFSIAVFSLCFIGPRAYYHHKYLRYFQKINDPCFCTVVYFIPNFFYLHYRFYTEHFKEYPRFRKALIPFIF